MAIRFWIQIIINIIAISLHIGLSMLSVFFHISEIDLMPPLTSSHRDDRNRSYSKVITPYGLSPGAPCPHLCNMPSLRVPDGHISCIYPPSQWYQQVPSFSCVIDLKLIIFQWIVSGRQMVARTVEAAAVVQRRPTISSDRLSPGGRWTRDWCYTSAIFERPETDRSQDN